MAAPSPPTGLEQRYGGTRARVGRRARVVIAVTLIGVSVAWVAWAALSVDRTLTWKDVGYAVTGDDAVQVTFDVTKPAAARAVCTVRALSASYAEVGRREVEVGPAASRTVRVSATVRTGERAVTGLVKGCATR